MHLFTGVHTRAMSHDEENDMNDKEKLEAFDNHGRRASFHYADDTASGEWRLGSQEERKARNLFADNPDLREAMTELASKFLWSL